MKGIVLAGGSGTRLHPATLSVNKQLLPIYDKPMIYYPLSVLMLAAIRDILIISSPEYIDNYKRLFGAGEHIGLNLSYAVQPRPEGIAQAFEIGRDFIGRDSVALILGDNIFFGADLSNLLRRSAQRESGATVFSYRVEHPEQYGVIELDSDNRPISLEEKPEFPKSNFAVTGLYFYDNDVVDIAKNLKPSDRGELEITDINLFYMNNNRLYVEQLSRGHAWFDTGTHDSMLSASEFVRTIQVRQGIQIACLEEIAYQNGFIDTQQLRARASLYSKSSYGQAMLSGIL